MKPNLLLSFVFILIHVVGYSQDRGYLAVSAGPSFPSGDFGSKDINNEAAGLATTGAIFDLTYAQKFGETYGMTFLLRGQANPTDPQPLVNELSAQFPTLFWTAESTNWGIGGLLGGLYGTLPVDKKGVVTFDTRAMIGYINATSAEFTVSAYSGSSFAWIETQSASAGAFAYLLGAGFKFAIGHRLGIFLNADYLSANPEFTNVPTITSTGGYSEDSYSQSFKTVNIGVGLGYRW